MDQWLAVMFTPTDQLLALARHAEALGFAGIAVADHIAVPVGFGSVHPSGENPFDHRSGFPDPFTTIAAMAAVTTTLRFMPYVYVLAMREPYTVAKQAGTLADLTAGRFALGVGVGWLREEIALLGVDPSTRGRRMDEMIEVMRRFWRDPEAEFHGEFFDFGPTGMAPLPSHPIPVWVGGKSTTALRRAAANDGWLGMNYGLDEIEVLLGRLADARARHLDDGGDADKPFETLVIPNALPDKALYTQLEAQGVTSTVALGWPVGDPAYDALDTKLRALDDYAAAFLAA
jgi:probable F420-dependent oxidoreductase